MASERIQRRIERLLDEAEQAADKRDWSAVRQRAEDILAFDPDNADAKGFLSAAQRALGTAVSSPVADATPPAPVHPASFASGRYAVKRFLGEGGKKRVYLAHDTLLDRDVAFALIKTEGLDPSTSSGQAARERITREAQAMGRLGDHPHIVTVYDIGVEPPLPLGEGRGEGGQPYLVLPLMPGGDVEGLIEKAENHQLSLEQAIRISDQLCQALEHAHSKGIIHRDIKPGNVWLASVPSPQPSPSGRGSRSEATAGEGIIAKLGDFGLAVAIDRSRLTQAGMMVGTVSYMPPEQALGGEITPRSDLYSVGCMLYEMVTGRPPFVGDDNVAIIGQHLNTPPVSPSWHRPDLPKGLETLILRLLEKDVSKRPASAAEVRQALAAIDLSYPSPQPSPARGEGATDNPLYRRTFVGREQELKQLQSAFDGAMSGQGSLAMVVGEPGIGKTALVEQLATYVSLRGGRTLVGHCYEEGSLSLPYLAFVEAMRSYVLAREPDALKSELGTGAADVARIVSEIRDRVSVELRPPGDPEDDRWRLLQAVSGFLRNAANVQPLLIVLEDLHWADRGTLDLLLHVARNLQGSRLVIIGTYRDVEVDRAHPLSSTLAELRRVGTFARVPLRGLTAEEVQRMLSGLATQDVGWALGETVHRQTEGNPLFVQEVMRYLAEEGLIAREEGRWRRTSDQPVAMAIPEGLRDVIGKRLSRLSAECNRLLAIAAVIGRDFPLAVLQRVSAASDEALFAALAEARGTAAIEERSVGAAVTYRFTHAFVRQTLYEEMIAPQRIRLHQQVARGLEALYGSRLEEHAVELAEHFSYSSDPADLAKAVTYGEMAARRALSVYAYTEAVGHLERCLRVQEVLDPDPSTDSGQARAKRCDLLLALGEALLPSGEPQRAVHEVAPEAFALAEALNDPSRAMRACGIAMEGEVRVAPGAAMGGRPHMRQWAARANEHARPGTVDRAYADILMAAVALADGQTQRCADLLHRGLDLARQLGDQAAQFTIAGYIVQGGGAAYDEEERLQVAEEFTRRPRQGISSIDLGQLLWRSGMVFLGWGDRARAEALWRECDELSVRQQDPFVIVRSMKSAEILALLDGRLLEAVEARERLLARAEELGVPDFGRWLTNAYADRHLLYLGRAEEALAARPAPPVWLLAHLGRHAEALQIVRSQLAARDPKGPIVAAIMTRQLEAAVLAGERELAAQLAPPLDRYASLALADTALTCPARHLGAAAALLGEPDKARAYYQQALEVCAKIRFRPEIALTRLQLAELLLEEAAKPEPLDLRSPPAVGARSPRPEEVGEETSPLRGAALGQALRAEALEHLDFAIVEFREMKMQPSLERALRHRGLLKA